MEIERKYLIKGMPPNLDAAVRLEIEQGYLCRKPVVRIRKSNDDYILTYKRKYRGSAEEGNPLMNEEIEVPLDEASYEHLKEKVDNNPIEKTRYVIALEDGLHAELDVFHGRLEGLSFVEVEFPDVEASQSFVPPDWFGEDVSSDPSYRNGYLSTLESADGLLKGKGE